MNRPAAGAAVSVMVREILRRPHNAVGVIVRETRVPIEHQRPVPAPHIDRAAVMTRMVIIEQRRPVEIHRRRRIRINRHRPAVIGPPVRIERDIIQKIHRPRTDPDCPRLVGQTMISLENDPFRTPVDIRDTVHPLRNDRAIIARGIQVEIRRSDILESRPVEIEIRRNPCRADPEKRISHPGKRLRLDHRVINRQRPVIAAEVKINPRRRPERDLVPVPVDFQVIRVR